jgi:hypothetical protein
MSFFNTTGLSGDALRLAVRSAAHQDQAVLAIFRGAFGPMAPSQVWQCGVDAGREWPIWSVRRAITNLTDNGALVKLDRQRRGPYGRPEFLWAVAEPRTHSPYRQPAAVNVEAA